MDQVEKVHKRTQLSLEVFSIHTTPIRRQHQTCSTKVSFYLRWWLMISICASIPICIPIALVTHDLSCLSCAAFKRLSSAFSCLASSSKMFSLLRILLICSVLWKVTGNSLTKPTNTSPWNSQRKMQVKECTYTDKWQVASPITLRTLLIMDLHQPFEHLAGSFCVPKAATRAVWMQCGIHLQTNNKYQ